MADGAAAQGLRRNYGNAFWFITPKIAIVGRENALDSVRQHDSYEPRIMHGNTVYVVLSDQILPMPIRFIIFDDSATKPLDEAHPRLHGFHWDPIAAAR